jgi:hypothetical protein
MRSLFPQSLRNLFDTMKRTLLVSVIILLLASCKTSRNETEQIEEFYTVFGVEQREAFELAVKSFDSFLEINFSEHKTLEEKLQSFLEEIMDSILSSRWQINMDEGREVLLKYEESGLRKEIWIYSFEEEDEEMEIMKLLYPGQAIAQEKDSSKQFIRYGAYLQGLMKIKKPSELVLDYSDARFSEDYFNNDLIINTILDGMKNQKYNPEILKRIIIAEFYFDLLQMRVPR